MIFQKQRRFTLAFFFLILIINIVAAQVWDGGASTTNWGDAMNWDTDLVPTASDDVTIGSGATVQIGASTAAVASSVSITSASLTVVGGGSLTISNNGSKNGILVDASALVNNGTLNITNCLNGILMQNSSSSFSNTNSATISNYANDGLGLNVGFSAPGCPSCTMDNSGTLNIDNGTGSTGAGLQLGASGAAFTNTGTGVLNIGATANAGFGFDYGFSGGNIDNSGTITLHHTGAGVNGINTAFFGTFLKNNSGGVINFQAGIGGDWPGDAGLDFTNDGMVNINKAGAVDLTLRGTGNFGGTEPLNMEYQLYPGASPGCMQMNSGFSISKSTMFSYSPTLFIELGGSTTACTDYDQLDVTGTATLLGNLSISLVNGFSPTGGETFEVIKADNISGTFDNINYPSVNGITWSTVYTASSVTVTASVANTATWDGGASTANWGDAMNWSPDAVPTSAHDVVIPSGTTVEIAASVAAVAKSVVLNSSASLTIANTGSLTVGGNGGNDGITVISASLANNGTLDLSNCLNGVFLRGNASSFVNTDQANIDNYAVSGVAIQASNCTNCSMNNSGTLNIDNGTGANGAGLLLGVSTTSFANSGPLNIGSTANAGAGISFGSQGGMVQNSGTLTIHNTGAGEAGIRAAVQTFSGTLTNDASGTINLGTGIGGDWSSPVGLIFINNGTANINKTSNVQISAQGSGTFAGSADLNMAGFMYPGNSPGCLSVANNLNLLASSTANPTQHFIEIGGTTPCTDYDQISVTGTATLTGDVNISFVNGFVPTAGQTFELLTAGSRVGTFSSISYPTVSGISWTTSYTATSVRANANSSLPVELIGFSAKADNAIVQLDWQTASETENEGFYVERSMDSRQWASLGFVSGQGNSTAQNEYGFTDRSVTGGRYYYRLRQMDFDGTETISKVVSAMVEGPEPGQALRFSPNPAGDFIGLENVPEEGAELQIFSPAGQLVAHEFLSENKNVDLAYLPAGLYLIILENGTERFTSKLVKR